MKLKRITKLHFKNKKNLKPNSDFNLQQINSALPTNTIFCTRVGQDIRTLPNQTTPLAFPNPPKRKGRGVRSETVGIPGRGSQDAPKINGSPCVLKVRHSRQGLHRVHAHTLLGGKEISPEEGKRSKYIQRSDQIEDSKAQNLYMKMYNEIQKQKLNFSIPTWEYVTNLINYYKSFAVAFTYPLLKGLPPKGGLDKSVKWKGPTGKILLGIYNKNKEAILKNQKIQNTNLIQVISKPEILLLAYNSILKSDKGVITKGIEISKEEWNNLNEEQKEFYLKNITFPDEFNMNDVLIISKLLRKGQFRWVKQSKLGLGKVSTSSPTLKAQSYLLTTAPIPISLYRVVEKAIFLVLQSIYEPEFEKLNKSFSYRPKKGIYDAMITFYSNHSSGKVIAIEGNIEAAYDSVNKKKMLEILQKKITDRKFMKLIEHKLNYTFAEKKENGKIVQKQPEKGIDSAYLFNIYMHELDKFIHEDIEKNYINKLNDRTSKSKSIQARLFTAERKFKKQTIDENNKNLVQEKTQQFFSKMQTKRFLKHNNFRLKLSDFQKKQISVLYIRYADNWILLTNGNCQIAEKFKKKISLFLETKLEFILSKNKTIIKDITKSPAKFLGFELRHPSIRYRLMIKNPKKSKFSKTNVQKQKVPFARVGQHMISRKGANHNNTIWLTPDKQRLINRMHMNGFCQKDGFPKEKPSLSCLKDQVIISIYNSYMREIAEYFMPIIKNKSHLQRWIYILRYSCFKTFAQKYRTSIRGIFKSFGIKRNLRSEQTIKTTIKFKKNGKIMEKSWTLYTYKDLKIMCSKEKKKLCLPSPTDY